MVSKNEHQPEQQGQREERILSDLLSVAEIIKSNRFMSLESQTELNIYVVYITYRVQQDLYELCRENGQFCDLSWDDFVLLMQGNIPARAAAIIVVAYIVLKNAARISDSAKKYGKASQSYPELLVYMEDEADRNSRYIIDYELIRSKILHQLPLPEHENIRSTASIGAELYPEYFGYYPVPFLTPWGHTTRNKVIANGVYWVETERCQWGLAVAYPKYDDLSEAASGLAEEFDDGSADTNGQMPGYLFFKETDSCVPLFELAFWGHDEQPYHGINRAALMNAIYEFHPEYAAQHNVNEQAGKNDGMGLLLRLLGNDVELESTPERLISLTADAGTEFITF